MTAVQVNSFEIDPGRKRVSSAETGFFASTSAYPYPLAKSTFPSFTTDTVAPAMLPRCNCRGMAPSRKASTSADVSSTAGFDGADDCSCAGAFAGWEAFAVGCAETATHASSATNPNPRV